MARLNPKIFMYRASCSHEEDLELARVESKAWIISGKVEQTATVACMYYFDTVAVGID